mgnify:CR=1 FL=1
MRAASVDVDGEAPVGAAVGAVRREPEEGEGRQLLELLLERDRRRDDVRRQALEPGIEGEVVDGPPRQRREPPTWPEDRHRHGSRGDAEEQPGMPAHRPQDAADHAHDVLTLPPSDAVDRRGPRLEPRRPW